MHGELRAPRRRLVHQTEDQHSHGLLQVLWQRRGLRKGLKEDNEGVLPVFVGALSKSEGQHRREHECAVC